MQNAKCRMQNAKRMRERARFALCILHFAFCIPSVLSAQDSTRTAPGIAGRAQLNASDDIAFRAMAIPDTVWVGQQATYQVGVFLSDAIRGRLRRNPVFVPPELRSMLAYDLASLNSVPRYAGDRRYEVHVFQRALFPLTAGRHEIPPARLEYALPLSNSFFAREESHSARTQSLVVIAREPPASGRPPEYRGAVGRLALQTRLDGRAQRTGDPFTFTVVVLGTGNVSLLPRPELSVAWADVVTGAVRVQMDSSTTLVRGRKEFDWILTPVRPGRQAMPAVRYAFFNPYTEQYEIAVGRADSITVSGSPVVADRSAADTTPILPVRRTYEGQVPPPITDSTLFWVLVALAPLPFLFVSFGRRQRPVKFAPPEAQIRDALREGRADPALVRRIFARTIAERANLSALEMTDEYAMHRALRRAGVSEQTASDAASYLTALDESVFGGAESQLSINHERAVSLIRAIDAEARSHAAIAASKIHRKSISVGLVAILSATAWAATQRDIVASTVFANGLAAYDAREFGSARQAFFELAQARPRAADAWFNFGAASWQLEDTAAAVIGWQRSMRLDPITNDARSLLRLAPGTPRLWHGVPPMPITTLAVIGASCWLSGFVLMAIGRRRRTFLSRIGGTLAVGAVAILLAGIKQKEILTGHDAGVVLSSARLRPMPVLSSEAGIEAQPGEVVRVIGRQGAWMNVELSDKRRGWVEAQRVQTLRQVEVTFSIAK
jgi:hypothetical protein